MKIKTSDLYKAIKFVAPASAGKNSGNDVYKGIKITTDGETAEFAAACGSVLHYSKVDLLEISPAEEFVCEKFTVADSADKDAYTAITLSDDKKTVTVTQSSQGNLSKSEVVKVIEGKFFDYGNLIGGDTYGSALSVWVDPVLLSKSLRAFTKNGSLGVVELRFRTGVDGKIEDRHPFLIENKQRRYDYNGIEKAVVAPLNRKRADVT